MNILERSAVFVQLLKDLGQRKETGCRQCPHCKSFNTIRYGYYTRRPWDMGERLTVLVQRHKCHNCKRSYSEESPELVYKSWYTRPVHRFCVDCGVRDGVSYRHIAELARSLMGRQERWSLWHPGEEGDQGKQTCNLAHTTVFCWHGRAGQEARKSVTDQLKEIACSGEMGTDGLWARLGDGIKRVALMLIDYESGLIFPPVIADGEDAACYWGQMFDRAEEAGLQIDELNGITSDGSQGLLSYLRDKLSGVHQQRCIWHLWRSAARIMLRQIAEAVKELTEEAAKEMRRELRRELSRLLERRSSSRLTGTSGHG